jgi:GNAT superfamily N-acetyltransferase
MISAMQLLAQGWGLERSRDRHLRYARALVARDVQWRGIDDADADAVARLVRENIRGIGEDWTLPAESGGVVAFTEADGIIGAMVIGAMGNGAATAENTIAFVQHIVVEPAWRGCGVGVVTLGMADQVFRSQPVPAKHFIGCCAPEAARWYQRAGYTVLQPGEILVLPGEQPVPTVVTNEHYPCWFFRSW